MIQSGTAGSQACIPTSLPATSSQKGQACGVEASEPRAPQAQQLEREVHLATQQELNDHEAHDVWPSESLSKASTVVPQATPASKLRRGVLGHNASRHLASPRANLLGNHRHAGTTVDGALRHHSWLATCDVEQNNEPPPLAGWTTACSNNEAPN